MKGTKIKRSSAKGGGRVSALMQKLRHPKQYKLQFQIVSSEENTAHTAGTAEQNAIATSPVSAETDALDAPERDTPVRAAKKDKPVKVKRKGGIQKKGIVIVAGLVAFAILTGAGISGIMINRSMRTPDNRLIRAAGYVEKEKYEKAIDTYQKLIDDNEVVVEAYLGMAGAYVAAEDATSAINLLEIGYDETDDTRLFSKAEELRSNVSGSIGTPEAVPAVVSSGDAEVSSQSGSETDGDSEEDAEPVDLPVTFSDPAFASMLRKALGKNADEPIYQSELDRVQSLRIYGASHAVSNANIAVMNTMSGYTIDGVLHTERGNIRSLDDIRHFRSLRRLTISYNRIQDISGLSEAANLDMLSLYCNEISDLSALKNLHNLEYLFLYNNNITDIAPLSEMKSLRQLQLQHNNITDLSPLRNLTSLEELFVGDNQISDISPISNLHSLYYFYAQNNQIDNIEAVSSIASLTDVSFEGNPVRDYSPTTGLDNINRPFGFTT